MDFPTKKEAKQWGKYLQRIEATRRLYPYFCKECKAWHITKQK